MLKVAVINDTRPTHHFGCLLVMKNLLHLLQQQQMEVAWSWPVSVDWRKHKRKIRSMPEVDAIIINGEGTIHHNRQRKFSQALIDFCEYASQVMKKPVYVVNATLNQNSPDAYQKLALARAIYVRDRGSLQELNDHDVPGSYVPDLTMAGSPETMTLDTTARQGTLVIDSAIKTDTALLRELADRHDHDFRSMIVARPGNARFLRSPRPWVKNIWKWLREDRLVSTDVDVYLQQLATYSGVITGRYHTLTMCLKQRVPFYALASNTPKVFFLLNDVFGDDHRQRTLDDIVANGDQPVEPFSEQELAAIDTFLAMANRESEIMIRAIAADIRQQAQGEYQY